LPLVASRLYSTFFLYLVAKSAAVFTDAFARDISFIDTLKVEFTKKTMIPTSKQWLSSKIISVHFDWEVIRKDVNKG
jgi:hypothetical protein